ncbi:MAG: sensor domain-containing protein [Streptosporangiaceae bacterium]
MSVVTARRPRLAPVSWRILRATFTRRVWADLEYVIAGLPLAVAGFAANALTFVPPILIAVSMPAMRKLGEANRFLARQLAGERVSPPPPVRVKPHVHLRTRDPARLSVLATAHGGRVRQHGGRVKITGIPPARLVGLATAENIAVSGIRSHSGWLKAAFTDKPGWRARGYLALKLPVSVVGLFVSGCCWMFGLGYLLYPVLWEIAHHVPSVAPGTPFGLGALMGITLAYSFAAIPLGAAMLLAAPWLAHATSAADRALIRGLLGPGSLAERVRDLEQTRAHAVDDSAARLRTIERDLHDGAQAQLIGLAMKLGLASEKLTRDPDGAVAPADLDRVAELVAAAHRGAIEAIAELRILARGIHPPVLDNGLADALTTLAARSAVPVELITDIGDRPSAAIETMAYFCAAELLANVAKHSAARRASLEAVHVLGLLRIRVIDDGEGGAYPDAGGGLRGLADRIRTVDGQMEIDSPPGGPTVVTVELPSHA